MERARRDRVRWALAAVAFAGWLTHVLTMRLAFGSPVAEVLWACHVAPLLLALGCALDRRAIVSVAATWMIVGTPLWLGDLVARGQIPEPTPVLVHAGELAIALAAARVVGWHRDAWWRAALALAALALITRFAPGAERANVNMVFRTWAGTERVFPHHAAFLAFTAIALLIAFYVISRAMERLTELRPPRLA